MNDMEIKNILNFLFLLSAQVEKIIKGGSVSILQLPGFYSAFEAAGPALSNINQLPSEVKSINDAVLVDLRTYVATNLSSVVPSPAVDAIIEDALNLAQQLYDFVESIKAAKNPPVTPAMAVPVPAPAS